MPVTVRDDEPPDTGSIDTGVSVASKREAAPTLEPVLNGIGISLVPPLCVTVSTKSIGAPQRNASAVLNWNGVVLVRLTPTAAFGYVESGCEFVTPAVEVESVATILLAIIRPVFWRTTLRLMHSFGSIPPLLLPAASLNDEETNVM